MENLERNEMETEQTLDDILSGLNLDIEGPGAEAITEQPQQQQEPEADITPRKKESGPAAWHKNVVMYVHDLLYLLAILIVVSLVFRVVVVSGTSMTDTLQNGDYLIVLSNVFYKNPQAGDIIVASKDSFDNGAPIIKRVIATEGQTVDIDFTTGTVTVDGVVLDEPYLRSPTKLDEGVSFPLVVEKGCIFVLGDNRMGSKDSRSTEIGQIDTREVLGKAIFLVLPGEHHATKNRDFGRIGLVN